MLMATVFNAKEQELFERICTMREPALLRLMYRFLSKYYSAEDIIVTPSYIIAYGKIPVALVSHADTVFPKPPSEFYYDRTKNVFWSPQGLGADDRAGIYAIIQIIRAGYLPHVIITTGEEKGCVGAGKLIGHYKDFPKELKFLVELDRRGEKDCVFYECENPTFEQFIESFGFVTNYGSLSDISLFGPCWKVAAVNVSVGYYDEHSVSERLFVGFLYSTIQKVCSILTEVADNEDIPVFEYIPSKYYRSAYCYSYPTDDDMDDETMLPLDKQAVALSAEADEWYRSATSCGFCDRKFKKEDLIPVHYKSTTHQKEPVLVCNECFATICTDLSWCTKCETPWFLSHPDDPTTWICPDCEEEKAKLEEGSKVINELRAL